jgi:hypothetical protein
LVYQPTFNQRALPNVHPFQRHHPRSHPRRHAPLPPQPRPYGRHHRGPPSATSQLHHRLAQARITRQLQEIAALKPADAAQAHLAAQILTTRELADAFIARAQAPNLEINQMCRLGRTGAELLRSAATLDRTLARHQQMPTPFNGTVIQDEADIPALETTWSNGISAPAGTGLQASTSADAPTTITPPPATPHPAPPPRPTHRNHTPTPNRRSQRRNPTTPPTPQPSPTSPRHPPARAPPAPTG